MLKILKAVFQWFLTWVYYVCLICFAGALLGVSSHLVFGFFFLDRPDYGFLAAFGFTNGLQYGGVWAGGFAIVLCVMRAHKRHMSKREVRG